MKHLRAKRKYKANKDFLQGCLLLHPIIRVTLLPYVRFHPPSLGNTMRYSALHCGQATRAVLLPRCFSSTQRCRQAWCTHLVEPRQRHGRTHSAVRSSSSVAKHTQQLLKANEHTQRLGEHTQCLNMTLGKKKNTA